MHGIARFEPQRAIIIEPGAPEQSAHPLDRPVGDFDDDTSRFTAMNQPRMTHSKPSCMNFIAIGKPDHVMSLHTQQAGANGYVSKGRELTEMLTAARTVLLGFDCFPAQAPHTGKAGGLDVLSPREMEVLQYLARGISNKEIASRLFLSDKTVSTYKTRLCEKLGLSSLAALIEFATLNKLID
jgi:two-component system response regulator FimZ (fimbrial Z protein)